MNILFFMGAGFSRPFGLPTMQDFFVAAEDSNRLSDNEKQYLRDIRLKARQATSFVESSPTNLEDILSLQVMHARLNASASPDSEAPTLESILGKIYSTIHDPDHYWDHLVEAFSKFLGYSDDRWRSFRICFVTTNYDLLLESALMKTGVKCNLGTPALEMCPPGSNVAGALYTGGVPIYKLHGSVNWFMPRDKIEVDPYIIPFDVPSGIAYLPRASAVDYMNGRNPIIIPPSFLKPEFVPTMREIWSSAAKAMNSARVVVFVGYSFPQSDIEMKFFLGYGLSGNSVLQKIVVVDTHADAIVSRLQSPTSGYGPHFRNFLIPVKCDWRDCRLLGHLISS